VLICGNGGSAADSEHIVGELMKGFKLKRPIPQTARAALARLFPEKGADLADHLQGALPAISLTGHPALSSAFANDVRADMVYAQQVYGYGRPGDMLIALSTSGNSTNILNAAKIAKAFGMAVLGMTGQGGGKLSELSDVCIRVPAEETYRVQELKLPVYHALCAMLEEEFFGEAAAAR
jgi:D-sedoheptulose 7-phosphate isomerase